MQKLSVYDIPNDYRYYRSGFSSYADYTETIFRRIVKSNVEKTGFFWWISRFLFWYITIAKFLKTPIVPTVEQIHEAWGRYGIIYWSPWGKVIWSLDGWKKLPPNKSLHWHHAGRSAFSILDTPEYSKKWSSNARNHLKQIKKNTGIKIQTVSIEEWLKVYRKTELPHRLKGYHSSALKRFAKIHEDKLRVVLASIDDVPLAGAVFLDEAPTSVYFVAFQNQAAKPHHLGLALIDWWFADSLAKWYKYLDFDHMWSPGDPDSYKGYTQFKSEIADYEIEFDEVYWRIF